MVGTTVRKPLPVLRAYLDSLDAQEKPKDVSFEYAFVPDWAEPNEAFDYLQSWVGSWVGFRRGVLLQGAPSNPSDFAEGPHLDSHHWEGSSMARVGYNKNQIIQYALNAKADAVWFVDADLLLDRTTFLSLDSCDVPIVSAVYWTKWSKRETETQKQPAQPQVWLNHPYQLDGRGMDAAEFRKKLIERQLTRVWGFGACTLIQRKVFEAGVDFSYLPDVSTQGLMGGEDRHFCIKCERLHIPAYADPWPDIFHCYHAEDIGRLEEYTQRLGSGHRDDARLGDLVSLRLRALEPLPVAPGKFQQLQPQLVRGRLGQIALEPEIEEAVLGMTRGQKQVVKVHHALHHPMPFMRGRTRLYEVTLIDCKENRPAPNLEGELLGFQRSRALRDRATLTPDQIEDLAEVG